MKLIYRIIIRIALMLTVVLGAWAVFFYIAVIDEVNDEVDDSLEDYSKPSLSVPWPEKNCPRKTMGRTINTILEK